MDNESDKVDGGITVVVPADKPELRDTVEQALSLMARAASGDPQAHKAATFGMRYSSLCAGGTRYDDQDKRVYSRDPDEIRAYWAERGVTPRAS